MSYLIIFKLLGSLALLMFGMKAMSEALQKMAGPQLRHVLGAMTTNRFMGVLTGTFITAAVQSSEIWNFPATGLSCGRAFLMVVMDISTFSTNVLMTSGFVG